LKADWPTPILTINPQAVIPAQAGIQFFIDKDESQELDPSLRWDDDQKH